mmetsp:Transcript_18074/g.41787  ORF Transcript_18074/g.41787 Transcript_18074/m.41787 type:complete len:135 (-) Transcript_18074:778-1182(-)
MPSLSGEANEGTLRGLFPGSRFEGTQRSGRSSYDVEVELQDVDLDNSFLCGYLKISGLTEEYPVLTTYFEAEIVGRHHNFVTEKWVQHSPALLHGTPPRERILCTVVDSMPSADICPFATGCRRAHRLGALVQV